MAHSSLLVVQLIAASFAETIHILFLKITATEAMDYRCYFFTLGSWIPIKADLESPDIPGLKYWAYFFKSFQIFGIDRIESTKCCHVSPLYLL